jgi:Ca2+-binding RTX toxin-like protein
MPDTPDTEADFLNGGAGDDLILTGAGDYANGGEGSDAFALQDIQPGDPLVQITDFNPAEDEIVVLYDATLHPSPELTLRDVQGSSVLLLDDVPLASLTNGATVDLSAVQLRAA